MRKVFTDNDLSISPAVVMLDRGPGGLVYTDNDIHMASVLGQYGISHTSGIKDPMVCHRCNGQRIVVNPGHSFYCRECREVSWIKTDAYWHEMLNLVAPLKTNWNTVGGMGLMGALLFGTLLLYGLEGKMQMLTTIREYFKEKTNQWEILLEDFGPGILLLLTLLIPWLLIRYAWLLISSPFKIVFGKVPEKNKSV